VHDRPRISEASPASGQRHGPSRPPHVRTAQPVVACRPAAPARGLAPQVPSARPGTRRRRSGSALVLVPHSPQSTDRIGVSCTAAGGSRGLWDLGARFVCIYAEGRGRVCPAGCPCPMPRSKPPAIEAEAWHASERGPRTQRTYVQYSYDRANKTRPLSWVRASKIQLCVPASDRAGRARGTVRKVYQGFLLRRCTKHVHQAVQQLLHCLDAALRR